MKTTLFTSGNQVYFTQSLQELSDADCERLAWLLRAERSSETRLVGTFVGPRKEMLTPWSTNATEIAQNSGVSGISRIEIFRRVADGQQPNFDRMLEAVYDGLDADTLEIDQQPKPVISVEDIAAFNEEAGLALSEEEITFLESMSKELGRSLTDSELYGFGQINSEHCRHKIFNGEFVIDGEVQEKSLFGLIKDTAKEAPENLVSAYKDNVAFISGPSVEQFSPANAATAGHFRLRPIDSVISIKAETHNFPTAVEPFNGASTGSGGEIRDRMAGGVGSIPLVGSAVYITSYPRLSDSRASCWEQKTTERDWKYQTPQEILTKASNGASDFGNKFGQPLIVGSVLTFEGVLNAEDGTSSLTGFDRPIMLAGGVGYGNALHAKKQTLQAGDKIVLLGGDNYRIGMAGGSVSSVDTGKLSEELELSAVQRANPEMQKRSYNVVRALSESEDNPIRSIHDHGAGGHMNCFSELLEDTGGRISIDALPLGDPTLSATEILSNESQERMGLAVPADSISRLEKIAERERSPMYVVGDVGDDQRVVFGCEDGTNPVDLPLEALFGSSPKTVLTDSTQKLSTTPVAISISNGEQLLDALRDVLSLEGVACKDWLTNKVDRCVSGHVAHQQTAGPLQLPLNDCGVASLDYVGVKGVASSIGHAPVPGLLDERAGAILSVAESLTNIVWAPLEKGLDSVVLSANWMWPAKQPGEDARLYRAVEALSEFSIQLGIAVPTGKDSMSMTMKYADGSQVKAPGTVIVSAAGQCSDVRLCVSVDLKPEADSVLIYVNLSGMESNPLGGSSFAQASGEMGSEAATVLNPQQFKDGFNAIQSLIGEQKILAGHDISEGGLLTCVSEMAFGGDCGVSLQLAGEREDVVRFLFSEKPAVVVQVRASDCESVLQAFDEAYVMAEVLGQVGGEHIKLEAQELSFSTSVSELRRTWFTPSYLLEVEQTEPSLAKERFDNFDQHPLEFKFPAGFTGMAKDCGADLRPDSPPLIKAAIVREKGTNGDREMAFAMFAAGFDVKDVTMSDLMSGRENLADVHFVVFPGGFSNSDVLGAGRGWAGAFRFNENAKRALDNFYARPDTLSLGVCNGCQLMGELNVLYPDHSQQLSLEHNASGKFESIFLNVDVGETSSVMLKPLVGSRLGIWVAHGEGRFHLPEGESAYDIPVRYVDSHYPANPNGSDANAAAVCSKDGRHLAIMPHLERSLLARHWPYYGEYRAEQTQQEVSPWMLSFVAAREWIESHA